MRHHLRAWLLFCCCGAIAAADEPAKSVERRTAPAGYQWQELEGMGGAVLLPKGWFFSKDSTKDAVVCRVVQEDPMKGKGFLTGLTVNLIRDVKKKTKADPSLYAVFYVDGYMKGAKVIAEPKVGRSDPFDRLVCEVEKELPDAAKGKVFRVRLLTLANKDSDTLYVVTFGAPKDEWEKAWKIGAPVFDGLIIPREPIIPAEKPPAAKVNAVRLYVPTTELDSRLGGDVTPFSEYIKAAEKAAVQCLATAKQPKAKGMLLTVGMKPNKTTRVWCDAVEGDVPAELLRKLEKEVAALKPCPIKATMAFGLQLELSGQKVEKFPEFPAVWLEAAKKTEGTLLIPPDELFRSIWPD